MLPATFPFSKRLRPWNKPLMDREEECLAALAQKVIELRLDAPAQFLIEAHLPLASLFYALTLLVEPVATPLIGAERVNFLRELFSDRTKLMRLSRLIAEARSPLARESS
jgi:hypothetical protein